jgi:mRNA interferase MazF
MLRSSKLADAYEDPWREWADSGESEVWDRRRRRPVLMLRGEIRLVELGQAMPGGAARRRPVVVISNDGGHATAARLGRGVITPWCPSSNVTRVYPFQVLLPAEASGLDQDSKAQAEQVRSVSVVRVLKRLGAVPAPRRFHVARFDTSWVISLVRAMSHLLRDRNRFHPPHVPFPGRARGSRSQSMSRMRLRT